MAPPSRLKKAFLVPYVAIKLTSGHRAEFKKVLRGVSKMGPKYQ